MARAPRMDDFTRAYFEAALWSSNDESNEQGGEPLDKNYDISDIASATRDKMIADCANFQERFNELISDDEPTSRYGKWELAGHDFWLTRNRHGAGFWDGDWPKHGNELDAASKKYGEFYLYIGDDGEIHGSPLGSHGVREAAGRRRPAAKVTWTAENTQINTWFERDRSSVVLETLNGDTIIEWWDEAVEEAVQDGFLDPGDWHGSAIEYANQMGAQPHPQPRRKRAVRSTTARTNAGASTPSARWVPSGGGTGWLWMAPSGSAYSLRRAGGGRWNLHIDGRLYGPFNSLDEAKSEAELHERHDRHHVHETRRVLAPRQAARRVRQGSGRDAEAGFAIGTYDQSLIEENTRDRADPKHGDREWRDEMVHLGVIDAQGEITQRGWNQLNRDITHAENNALAWMRATFNNVRDEGHGGDDLVGTFWFDPTDSNQAHLVELATPSGRGERIDMVDATFGDLSDMAFNEVSDFGGSVLGGAITFFDVKPEDMETIEQTLEHELPRGKRSTPRRR